MAREYDDWYDSNPAIQEAEYILQVAERVQAAEEKHSTIDYEMNRMAKLSLAALAIGSVYIQASEGVMSFTGHFLVGGGIYGLACAGAGKLLNNKEYKDQVGAYQQDTAED